MTATDIAKQLGATIAEKRRSSGPHPSSTGRKAGYRARRLVTYGKRENFPKADPPAGYCGGAGLFCGGTLQNR